VPVQPLPLVLPDVLVQQPSRVRHLKFKGYVCTGGSELVRDRYPDFNIWIK
jgi:hypothetical protein